MGQNDKKTVDANTYIPLGIGVGVAIGTGVGVAIGNIGLGIGIGISMGAMFGGILYTQKKQDDERSGGDQP